jgi:hypothetical protein
MKTPYIYTMPESFLLDQSVPARWRLLAVINGFLLNGKTFYGSNVWLMEQLGCSEQTVTNAVAELEKLGEIVCTRTKRSRLINRKMRDPNQLGSETQVGSVRDPSQLGTTSELNSETNSSELEVREEYEDSNGNPIKGKKVTFAMKEVFALFQGNPARLVWPTRSFQREAAKVLHETYGIEELKKRYSITAKYKNDPMCPQIDSPADFLDKMPKMEKFLRDLR